MYAFIDFFINSFRSTKITEHFVAFTAKVHTTLTYFLPLTNHRQVDGAIIKR